MKKILNFFAQIAYHWWIFWSNIRFRKNERFNNEVLPEDKVSTVADVRNLAKKLYKSFEYKSDGVDQLFDAILPPPDAYKKYLTGKLKEDCDGFHSLLLQCLKASNIECYLLAVNAKGSGHCVLIFYMNTLWHVVDYSSVYIGYKVAQNAINKYNTDFVEIYKAKSKVFANTLVDYNYDKGKFKLVKVKKIEKTKE